MSQIKTILKILFIILFLWVIYRVNKFILSIQITKRNAESILNALGFEVSSFQYVDNIGKDMVLEVLYNGEKMNIGDAIARGSKLELILGNGKK